MDNTKAIKPQLTEVEQEKLKKFFSQEAKNYGLTEKEWGIFLTVAFELNDGYLLNDILEHYKIGKEEYSNVVRAIVMREESKGQTSQQQLLKMFDTYRQDGNIEMLQRLIQLTRIIDIDRPELLTTPEGRGKRGRKTQRKGNNT